jgi:hypothetical protein
MPASAIGGPEAAVSHDLSEARIAAGLERHQRRRPTRPRLPVRPGDAALWRRRPRPPSTVSHEVLNSTHKSSSLAGIARTAASGQSRQRRTLAQHDPAGLRAFAGAASATSSAAGSPPRKQAPRWRRARPWPGRGMSPMHSRAASPSRDGSDPGVELLMPSRATVRVGSKAEPRPGSKAI